MNSITRTTAAIVVASLCFGCSSPGQQRHFYTLHSQPQSSVTDPVALDGGLGVGPIDLPESFSGDGIVSVGPGQQVIRSQTHLWAGDLKQSISRTVATNLAQQLAYDDVWPYPWDTRHRPKYQISILVEQLRGELGEDLTMVAKWTLFGDYGKKVIDVGRQTFMAQTADDSYASYVTAINDLVNQFSLALESVVREQLLDGSRL